MTFHARPVFYAPSFLPPPVCSLGVSAEHAHSTPPHSLMTKVLDRGMTNLALSQEMMRAAASDNLDAVERCLMEGTSPNAVNPIGQTALHIAAIWNNVKVATALIDAGASLSPPNQYGATPLHFAAQKGHIEFCQLLVAQRGQNDPVAVPTGQFCSVPVPPQVEPGGSRQPVTPSARLSHRVPSHCLGY